MLPTGCHYPNHPLNKEDSYTLTPAQLLDILQENEYREHEMEREMQQEMEQEMEHRQVTREMAQDAQDLSLEGTYI